jgi:3-keto-disaccharide hydrolase
VNGVKVQDNVELPNKTGAGQEEAPTLLPTRIQDHGNPVRFRNIWLIDRGLAPVAKFPIRGKGKPKNPKKEKPALVTEITQATVR